jgi:membrane protein DedA with SNARE-associated domain
VERLFDWLTSLPLATLYLSLGVVAAAENIFPPVPADTVVALGSFLAARGDGSVWIAFLVTWFGNIAGAMIMYAIGRRYGAEPLERRLLGDKGPGAERRLERLYGKYGTLALFVSRFIPGVRAIVPPFAGALRIPPIRAAAAMGAASAIWYGVVSYLGFTLGGNWQSVQRLITEYGRAFAIGGAVVLLVGLVIWRMRLRKAPEA